MKRIAMTILAAAASLAHAEGDKSVTRLLLEKDAQIAVRKADQELAKSSPVPVVSTPTPTAEGEVRGMPKTVAVFGVDGSKAGLPVTLRSYVKWGSQVYPAKVGGSVRGYKVLAVTEAGTKLSKGKQTLTAERVDDDTVLLEEPARAAPHIAGKPTGPLPAQTPAAVGSLPSQPSVMPFPVPGVGTGVPPVPSSMPAVPSAAPAVAQG